MKRVFCSPLTVLVLIPSLVFLACGDDDDNPSDPDPPMITSYDEQDGWNCLASQTCQDVFNIHFAAGSTVSFQATDITGDSIVQLALYAPGEPLGGTNLFTGTANELRCNYVDGCTTLPAGQSVSNFAVAAAGTYKLAITRDWAESCGSEGTYRLVIDSDKGFTPPARSFNDITSLAPATECP